MFLPQLLSETKIRRLQDPRNSCQIPDPYSEENLKKNLGRPQVTGLSGGKLKKFGKMHELNVRIKIP